MSLVHNSSLDIGVQCTRDTFDCPGGMYSAMQSLLDHVVLTDDIVRTASSLGHPPLVHILVGFSVFVVMQFLADIAHRLMVAETTDIEISPPKIFVKFGIVCIQKFEIVSQSFGTVKYKSRLFLSWKGKK